VTIKVELIFNNHVEPYTTKPINGNYAIFDPNKEDADHEKTTLIEEVPDIVLDE
ncbi:hypothetical protein KI387_044312, partial [Taxus chinensis]